MAINLLPNEQKNKFKKQKSLRSYQEIEMTGAEKMGASKPGIKKRGVLSFFKQSVAKLNEEKVEPIEESQKIKLPDQQVLLKQKITYKNIFDAKKPHVIYHVPERKPISNIKKRGLFFGFGGKKTAVSTDSADQILKQDIRTTILKDLDKEQFPKYNSINTEKVLTPVHNKTIKTKIIEVTSSETEKDKKISTWERFKIWLSGLFTSPKKQVSEFKNSDKISKLAGSPTPTNKPLEISEEKQIITSKEQKVSFDNKIKSIDRQIGLPDKPREKDKLISYATPIEVEEEISIEKESPKKIESSIFKPEELKYAQPDIKQEKIIATNFLDKRSTINIDKVIKEDVAQKLTKNKFGLWQKFVNWLSGIFKHNKNDNKIDLATQKIEIIKEEVKPKIEQEKSIIAEQSKPGLFSMTEEKISPPVIKTSKPDYIQAPTLTPPPVAPEISLPPKPNSPVVESPKLSMSEDKKAEKIIKEEVISVPPPPAPTKADDKNIDEGMSQPMGFNGDQMNWEVNLIPEEAQEKELPISKILILAMSIIISVGLVFGGWLWANYYYNTISVTISEVDAEIANIESQVAKFGNIQEESSALQKKIENVNLLLEKHIYWSEFFNKLEFYTSTNIYYENMAADVNGNITLAAVSNSYENVIKQLYVFKEADDFVLDVTISEIAKDMPITTEESIPDGSTDIPTNPSIDAVKFNITLSINPELFYIVN